MNGKSVHFSFDTIYKKWKDGWSEVKTTMKKSWRRRSKAIKIKMNGLSSLSKSNCADCTLTRSHSPLCASFYSLCGCACACALWVCESSSLEWVFFFLVCRWSVESLELKASRKVAPVSLCDARVQYFTNDVMFGVLHDKNARLGWLVASYNYLEMSELFFLLWIYWNTLCESVHFVFSQFRWRIVAHSGSN